MSVSATTIATPPSCPIHTISSGGLPSRPRRGQSIKPKLKLRKRQLQRCRALFSDDAPFAMAIGAYMFTSLLFPISLPPEDDGGNSTNARFAVMGIVSFIPYSNWLVSYSALPIHHIFYHVDLDPNCQ